MTRIIRHLLACLCLSIFCVHCQKHAETTLPPPVTPPVIVIPPVLDQMITASVQGRVVDESGAPVSGAMASVGTSSIATDVNGTFSFSSVQLSKFFGTVTILQKGYFKVTRTFVTSSTGMNFINVRLIPRVSKGSFPATSDATISVDNGSSVAFKANGLSMASSGTTYSGTVHVYGTYLDPTDAELTQRMPGDLRGNDTAGKIVALQSFGMLGVELESDAGEKLQVATGSKATITIPIAPTLQSMAPATIPLWYFNDTTGKWIEQGFATKQGTNYVGTVGHFSFWNCDAGVPVAYIHGYLHDQQNNPLANIRIFATNKSNGQVSDAYSASDGSFAGGVPIGGSFTLSVSGKCGNVWFSKDIGPVTDEIDLGTIIVTVPATGSVTISGTAIGCDGNPVSRGFARVMLEGLQYSASVANGIFSLTAERCTSMPDSAYLTIGDYSTLAQSLVHSYPVTVGAVDAGQVVACGADFPQYIRYTISGTTYLITSPPDSITLTSNYFTGYTLPGSRYISLYPFTKWDTGTYSIAHLYAIAGRASYGPLDGDSVSVTITKSGSIWQSIYGSFSVPVFDTLANKPTLMTGSFKLTRTFQ